MNIRQGSVYPNDAGLISVLYMSMGLHLQIQNAHRRPRNRSNILASQQRHHAGKAEGQQIHTDTLELYMYSSSVDLAQCSIAVGMGLQSSCHKGVRC